MTPQILAVAQLLFLQMIGIGCWTSPSYGDDTLQKADALVKSVRNSIGMNFVQIPAGEFLMGFDEPVDELLKLYGKEGDITQDASIQGLKRSQPSHRVVITKPFYLGQYEVTVGQFRQFVESTKYVPAVGIFGGGWGVNKRGVFDVAERFSWKNPGWEQTDDHPVGNVTWNDAAAYCQWLSKTEQKEYRLPTEAEWEYACRAGSKTRYSFGDDPEGLAEYGNVEDRIAGEFTPGYFGGVIKAEDGYVFTAPVGKFRPNAWGLHDMHGNVHEWCSDWTTFKDNYYETSETEDPQGRPAPTTEDPKRRYKVIRGGDWNYGAWAGLSASRGYAAMGGPMSKHCGIGFRVVVNADPSLPPEVKSAP